MEPFSWLVRPIKARITGAVSYRFSPASISSSRSDVFSVPYRADGSWSCSGVLILTPSYNGFPTGSLEMWPSMTNSPDTFSKSYAILDMAKHRGGISRIVEPSFAVRPRLKDSTDSFPAGSSLLHLRVRLGGPFRREIVWNRDGFPR